MFSGISVAMSQGKTGYLVVLFSLLLTGYMSLFLSMTHLDILILDMVNIVWGIPSSHTDSFPIRETFETVLLEIPVPRTLICAAVVVALSVSGKLLQGILLNSLAVYLTLIVSEGTAFDAGFAILKDLSVSGQNTFGNCFT